MVICVVVGCSKRSDHNKGVSFHRIPTVRRHYGKQEWELLIRRRDGCLAAINIDINELGSTKGHSKKAAVEGSFMRCESAKRR